MKKIVDERQQIELMKIEHIGFWIMYWMLCAVIVIQCISDKTGIGKAVMGESIVLLTGSIVVLAGCIRKGLWSYTSKPLVKNYLLYSVAGALAFGVIDGINKYINIEYFKGRFSELILTVGVSAIFMFAITFVVLFVCGTLVNKRKKKLEQDFDEDDK